MRCFLFLLSRKNKGAELHVLLCITFLLMTISGIAQEEQPSNKYAFKGSATITNNGVSLVPSFSLGDPALLFDLKFTKDRFSIEPDFRFALEGKPWLFLVWFRYKAIEGERFSFRVGAHPAMNFRTIPINRNGGPIEDILEARRYLAAELAPTYKVSDKLSLGLYYLHGRGFDEGVKQTHFLTFNTILNHLYISEQVYLNFTPQIYLVKTDDLMSYYVAGTLSLAKDDFPLSLSLLVNQTLAGEIPVDDFFWSGSLVYRF